MWLISLETVRDVTAAVARQAGFVCIESQQSLMLFLALYLALHLYLIFNKAESVVSIVNQPILLEGGSGEECLNIYFKYNLSYSLPHPKIFQFKISVTL